MSLRTAPKLNALWRCCCACLLLAACSPWVPATAPPQLEHTPGPQYSITATKFEIDRFQLRYPASWRVVYLSTAEDRLHQVAFVAPDQSVVMVREVESADESGTGRSLLLENGVNLSVEVKAADDAPAAFSDQAEQLIASIQGSRID